VVEYGMKLPTCNGTQNPPRRDPQAVTRLTTWQCSRGPLATAVNARTFSPSLTPPQRLCTVRNMSNDKAAQDAKPLDFEAAMRDLEELVERLEHGDLPLEESLAAFERGVMLTRSCQAALKEAEQKVEILLKKAGESRVEDFNADETKAT
jgi:exodeoxyribonuclease VII small subunit